jgi:hypothetical protein
MGYGKESRSVIVCKALPGKPGKHMPNDGRWRSRIAGTLGRIGSFSRRATTAPPQIPALLVDEMRVSQKTQRAKWEVGARELLRAVHL